MEHTLYRKSKFIIFFLSIFICLPLTAAEQRPGIRGTVFGTGNEILTYADVQLKDTDIRSVSDNKGNYALMARPGKYTVVASVLGYKPYEMAVELRAGEIMEVDFYLEEESIGIESVAVKGKSYVQQINESSFNVVAIDASALHNTNLDIAHVLDRVSGVKIRESGGVGSGASISLNGFSGRHVKVFMDGIPMEGNGSSFQINNIPVSLAERIEVYKGVVPVELGADALGGAINIVTRNTTNTYLDVSYSYGSFNTHRSGINFGHVARNGLMVQVNAYQNYSDNNYRVKTQLLDLQSNTYSTEEYWFRRFHDMYRNEAVMAKIGVSGKRWASRLLFGVNVSQEQDEIQNANIMKVVYGGKLSKSHSITPSLNYDVKNLFVCNLDLSVAANYNMVHSKNIDTMARQYNWNGDFRQKSSRGEASYTLAEYDNNSLYVTANLRYRIGAKHNIVVNNVFNSYQRKMSDDVANADNVTDATFMKRVSNKNVLGLSYKYSPVQSVNISAFGKFYQLGVKGPVNTSSTSTADYQLQKKDYNTTGYGLAATYLLASGVQFKASYEQAYRLPTERELFGDEILETGDMALKPEKSQNINLNVNYNGDFSGGHALYAEVGFIYRDTKDYIRRQVEQRYGGAYYTNHGNVKTIGADMEARYFWRDRFSAGGNVTWQNIRNKERYSVTGQELIYYNDRMPNVPYLFSNFDASYNFHNVICKGNTLTLTYTLNYVHDFYRSWKSEGGDIIIPEQLSHDVSLTYSFRGGQYNVSVEALNITDKMLYDNYSLQKPGRSFYFKARYFFFKSASAGTAKIKESTKYEKRGRGPHHHGGKHHSRTVINN